MNIPQPKKENLIFAIPFLFLTVATAGLYSIPLFMAKLWPSQHEVIYWFIAGYLILLIELVSAIVGTVGFLRSGRRNLWLLAAFLIISFKFAVSKAHYTFFILDIGFMLRFGGVGIGINLIGVIFLVWYFSKPVRMNWAFWGGILCLLFSRNLGFLEIGDYSVIGLIAAGCLFFEVFFLGRRAQKTEETPPETGEDNCVTRDWILSVKDKNS